MTRYIAGIVLKDWKIPNVASILGNVDSIATASQKLNTDPTRNAVLIHVWLFIFWVTFKVAIRTIIE